MIPTVDYKCLERDPQAALKGIVLNGEEVPQKDYERFAAARSYYPVPIENAQWLPCIALAQKFKPNGFTDGPELSLYVTGHTADEKAVTLAVDQYSRDACGFLDYPNKYSTSSGHKLPDRRDDLQAYIAEAKEATGAYRYLEEVVYVEKRLDSIVKPGDDKRRWAKEYGFEIVKLPRQYPAQDDLGGVYISRGSWGSFRVSSYHPDIEFSRSAELKIYVVKGAKGSDRVPDYVAAALGVDMAP